MILKTAGIVLAAVIIAAATPQSATKAQTPLPQPVSGRALVERMHAAYDGK